MIDAAFYRLQDFVYQRIGPESAGVSFDAWQGEVEDAVRAAIPCAAFDILLAALGNPPGWEGDASLHDLLAPVYDAAVRYAGELLKEHGLGESHLTVATEKFF